MDHFLDQILRRARGAAPLGGHDVPICRRARTGASRSSGEQSMANRSNVPSSDQFCDGSVRLNPRHLIVRFRLQSADVASRNERLVRVDLPPSPVGVRTAGIGRKPDVSGSRCEPLVGWTAVVHDPCDRCAQGPTAVIRTRSGGRRAVPTRILPSGASDWT
jgi:hypothetical protein